jgi:hypothetical protein
MYALADDDWNALPERKLKRKVDVALAEEVVGALALRLSTLRSRTLELEVIGTLAANCLITWVVVRAALVDDAV